MVAELFLSEMHRMLPKRFLLFLLCLLPVLAEAQDAVLQLKITDGANGEAMEAAAVGAMAAGSNTVQASGTSDEAGMVQLTVSAFPCRIAIQALGYEPFYQTVKSRPASGTLVIGLSKRTATLEETVVTGVASPVKIQDALSQYRVITTAQMRAQGAITLADALPYQLNMNVNSDQNTGARLNMQGLSGDKVKILIDGLPVNGRESGSVDLGQLNLNNAERVEIIQGPMSVVYGSDALGGVINIISRQNIKPLELNAQANYESIGKYNFNAYAGLKRGKRHSFSLSGGRNFFKGWYDLDTNNAVPKRSLWWKPKEQYFGTLTYGYSAPSGFRLQFASDYLDEKVTNLGPISGWPHTANALDKYYYNKRSMNRLILGGKAGSTGQWQLQNGLAYYHRYSEVLFKDMTTLSETQRPEEQDTTDFLDLTFRGSYGNKWQRLEYSAGYDVNLQFGESSKIGPGEGTIHDYAVFGSASYALLKDVLTAQLGLRAAYNTRYNAPIMPSLNLLYTPVKKVQVRASYARGYRAPSLKEMYLEFIDNNHHIIGNPDLLPEEGDHFQASASWQLYRKGNTFAQLVVTGYYNDVRNQIALLNLHPDIPNNIDYTYGNFNRLRNLIGNAQAELQFRNCQLTAGFSYNHTYKVEGVVDAYNVYELNGSFQYYLPVLRTAFNAFVKHSGSMPQFSENIGGDVTYKGMLPSSTMLDASLSRKFWNNRIQLIAGVKNILDVQMLTASGGTTGNAPGGHSGSGSVSFLPRRLFMTLRYTF